MISEVLKTIKSELPRAIKEPFKNNYLADYIRNEAVEILKENSPDKFQDYIFKGSAGMSKWVSKKDAWIGAFNPKITNGASKGYYVVYGFPIQSNYISIALGQAHEEAKKRYGTKNWKSAIENLANLRQLEIPSYRNRFLINKNKESSSFENIYYGEGNIYQKLYDYKNLPQESELIDDLASMLYAYEELYMKAGVQLDSRQTPKDDSLYLEIIEQILDLKSDKGPLHLNDITQEAVSMNLITNSDNIYKKYFRETLNYHLHDKFNSHGGDLYSLKKIKKPVTESEINFRNYSKPKNIATPKKESLSKSGAKKRNISFNSHKEMELELATILEKSGISPFQVSSGPNVDLCWKSKLGLNIIEVKSINKHNEDHQIRIGIGQLLEYIHRFKKLGSDIENAYLCLTDEPRKALWSEVLEGVNIELITPSNIKTILS
ncbi:DUF3578 domain-containing protein [Gammaproteobacteria bacterium]|nr:DUF3578 domain-containing protein [Gammaproteobacteria bacterium]